jgi:hypothetical protein
MIGRALWIIGVGVSVMLLSQAGWGLAAGAALQGAKALFYSESGTMVAPRSDNPAAETGAPTAPDMGSGPSETGSAVVPETGGGTGATGQPSRPGPKPQRSTKKATTTVSKDPWFGIAYWVEWERPGASPARIADPARFVFQSGDRIRFHVKTNTEGYLYVLNRGSSGATTVLFPHAGPVDRHYRVKAREDYTVPPSGWIRFDHQPGEEGVLFLLSQYPLTNVLDTSPRSEGLRTSDVPRLMTAVDRRGAKDLLVETDDTHAQQATYAGARMRPSGGNPEESPIVTVQTRLQHQ